MFAELLHLIRNHYSSLPPQQQKLADFVLDHPDQVPFLPVEELAKRAGVSTATVVRFAQSLGYEGFGGIKALFQQSMKEQERETPLQRLSQVIQGGEESNRLVVRSFKEDIYNLDITIQEFRPDTFQRVVDKITRARKVFLVGFGSCHALSYFLHFHLNRLTLDTEIIAAGGHQLFEKLAHVEAEDLVLVISFPRYSVDSLNALRYAKKCGVPTVLMTDSVQTPLAKLADDIVVATCKTTGFANSFVAAMALCNALILMIGLKDVGRSTESLRKLDRITSENNLYV